MQGNGSEKCTDLMRNIRNTARTNDTMLCGDRYPYELTPSRCINSGLGWLSPEGVFYGCDLGWHSIAAAHIAIRVLGMDDGISHYEARTKGYSMLSKQHWVHVSYLGSDGTCMESCDFRHATQAQIDAILIWCSEYEIPLPDKMQTELECRG